MAAAFLNLCQAAAETTPFETIHHASFRISFCKLQDIFIVSLPSPFGNANDALRRRVIIPL
jgi:hypothetical protein